MMCIVNTLPPINIPGFIKLARIQCSYLVILGSIYFCNNLTIALTIVTTVFMQLQNKNDMHNQRIATCSYAKLHQTSLRSFRVI